MIKTELVEMTPERASKLLANNPCNRNVSQNRVYQYATDMMLGTWSLTGQAIFVCEDGRLLDGQHRLYAVIKSGVTVPMILVTGLPASGEYDAGRPRSLRDRLVMSGSISEDLATRRAVAVANLALECNPPKDGRTGCSVASQRQNVTLWLQQHQDLVEFISTIPDGHRRGSVCSAPIVLAMISALDAGVPKEELLSWLDIVETGFSRSTKDDPAICLRNFLLDPRGKHLARKGYARTGYVKRAQSSIRHYLADDGARKLYEPKNYLYPIPGVQISDSALQSEDAAE